MFEARMKILALSDINEFHWTHGTGQVDVVMSCGDVTDQVILEALQAYACPRVFAIKGNHDSDAQFSKPIVDLHLHIENCDGMKFGGLNGAWKYKPRGHFLYDQREIDKFLASFPPVDIFLSHNSPRGIHDQEDEVHYGFDGLKSYIMRMNPRLVIYGHQHADRETQLGQTRIVGIYGYKLIEM